MKRSAPEVRLSLLLSLCAACASASAATTAWRTELARGGVEGYGNTYLPGEIHPTPDGFWLISSSSTSNWIARHARDGSRIGLQRFGGRIGYATTDSRGDAVLRHGPGDYGFVETIDECVVERGA